MGSDASADAPSTDGTPAARVAKANATTRLKSGLELTENCTPMPRMWGPPANGSNPTKISSAAVLSPYVAQGRPRAPSAGRCAGSRPVLPLLQPAPRSPRPARQPPQLGPQSPQPGPFRSHR